MVASYLDPHTSSSALIPSKDQINRFRSEHNLISIFKLAIAGCCLVSCIVFVPEEPIEMASICQRHNSINACEVW